VSLIRETLQCINNNLHRSGILDVQSHLRELLNTRYPSERKGGEEGPIFISAVENRSCGLQVVQLLIDYHADLNGTNQNGDTAAIIAARQGSLDKLKLLIDSGADLSIKNANGDTAFIEAAKNNQLNCINSLIGKASLEEKNRALLIAEKNGQRDIVQKLLTHGAEKNINAEKQKAQTLLNALKDSYEKQGKQSDSKRIIAIEACAKEVEKSMTIGSIAQALTNLSNKMKRYDQQRIFSRYKGSSTDVGISLEKHVNNLFLSGNSKAALRPHALAMDLLVNNYKVLGKNSADAEKVDAALNKIRQLALFKPEEVDKVVSVLKELQKDLKSTPQSKIEKLGFFKKPTTLDDNLLEIINLIEKEIVNNKSLIAPRPK
jgi:ankyrin repeat protein